MSAMTWGRRGLLAVAVGAAVTLSGGTTLAQEHALPTGAARVVKKVQLMALTGKSEIEYKVGQIVANNTSKLP